MRNTMYDHMCTMSILVNANVEDVFLMATPQSF